MNSTGGQGVTAGKRIANVLMIVLVAMVGAVTRTVHADMIFVVDARNDFNSTTRGNRTGSPYNDTNGGQTFDLSTGGDSASGLTGTLTVSETNWFEEQRLAPVGVLGAPPVTGTAISRYHQVFHGDYAGDLNGADSVHGGTDTAVWTAEGYPAGSSITVYLHYTYQGNYADAAPYVLTGGTAGTINMLTAPVADLVLNDTVKDHDFELLGTATADSSGQVQLTLTGADGWTPVDTAAFVGGAVVEEGTVVLIR